VLDGVAGSGAPIQLDFENPGGARTGKLLPSGHPSDVLTIDGPDGAPLQVSVSMVDAANPCVFVAASTLGATGIEMPQALEDNAALMATLEQIRRNASVAMGLAKTLEEAARIAGVPKVAMVAPAGPSPTLSGRMLATDEVDILVRMISIGQPHKAVPLTGALCLAAACRVPGSVPSALLTEAARSGTVRIGHPSGVILVAADVETNADASVHVRCSTVFRTARRLFQGEVFYRTPKPGLQP